MCEEAMRLSRNLLHRLAWLLVFPFLIWHLTPLIIFMQAPEALIVLLGVCIVCAPLVFTLPMFKSDSYRKRTYVYSTCCAFAVVLLWAGVFYLIALAMSKGRW